MRRLRTSSTGFAASLGVLFAIGFPARTAEAHGGNPALAFMLSPPIEGARTSTSYPIRWIDADVVIATGTATVNLFYTSRIPPTFRAGVVPATLEGTPIAVGVREADTRNVVDFDTTEVPAGNYFVWSRLDEPAVEMSIKIISFAPGVLSVDKPGVPRKPWIVISKPDSPFRYSDTEYSIEYRAFDPDGTGRVRLEATRSESGEGRMVLADDLPASGVGTFVWQTTDVLEGDWAIYATITDARGETFSAWSRYFLLVTHPFVRRDAGLTDDDAGVGEDAGVEPPDDAGDEGCACDHRAPRASGFDLPALASLFGLALVLRARKRPRLTSDAALL